MSPRAAKWDVHLLLWMALSLSLVGCGVVPKTPSSLTRGSGDTSSDQNQDSSNQEDHSDGGTDSGTIPNGNSNGNHDGGVIAHFKPALAVRATGCMMCHARVESNLITDFGFGNSFYFGNDRTVTTSPFSGQIYGDHSGNWASAKVWGKIFVPVTGANSFSNNLSLKGYLQSQVAPPDSATPAPIVEEKSSIFIGAPAASEIRRAAGIFPAEHPRWVFAAVSGTPAFSGLEELSTGYFRNAATGSFDCVGDLFIEGSLFLKDLALKTTNAGCRIHATGSIFVQGPIQYLGDASDRNLQLVSARAIVLGMGTDTLRERIQRHWCRPGFLTRDNSGTTQEKLDRIVSDSESYSQLTDATSQVPLGRAVTFERLLLVAPQFHSRYQGNFKGVIVAEVGIASLGSFAFRFDSIFERVPVLPRISPSLYLKVE